jgi:hypothetical protein
MRPALRKAILFTILLGIVVYLVVDSADDAGSPHRAQPVAAQRPAGKDANTDTSVEKIAGRYALPDRPALSAPHAQLFGAQSWQAKMPQRAAKPMAPRVPAMPYRYAGKVLHEGRTKVYLAKGNEVFPVRKGETLDGAYRVQSIEKTQIRLLYLPLGRVQTIPVDSALPLAVAKPAPMAAAKTRHAKATAKPSAPAKAARVLWEGPKQVKLGSQFSVKLHLTSEQPVAASPMQFKFDPRLLETVAVKPGRFFDPGRDQFSVRVNPEGSIVVGATHRRHAPAADAEFLVLTFRPIKPAAVAELSIASLSLQGPAGRRIEFDSPAAFRTAITP